MKTYIINVSTNEVRRQHMRRVLESQPCLDNYTFIQKGDINDITKEIHNQYFSGELSMIGPAVSCAYKHILAYKTIVEEKRPLSLILEDDITFDRSLDNFVDLILAEISSRKLSNFIVSLEDSNLKYVKGSERRAGQKLYIKQRGRMAGAYMIDLEGAESILNEIFINTCHLPIDWFHNHCSEKSILNIYWSHPSVATQGSLDGRIPSMIDNKQSGTVKIWKFKLSKGYKKLIYRLR